MPPTFLWGANLGLSYLFIFLYVHTAASLFPLHQTPHLTLLIHLPPPWIASSFDGCRRRLASWQVLHRPLLLCPHQPAVAQTPHSGTVSSSHPLSSIPSRMKHQLLKPRACCSSDGALLSLELCGISLVPCKYSSSSSTLFVWRTFIPPLSPFPVCSSSITFFLHSSHSFYLPFFSRIPTAAQDSSSSWLPSMWMFRVFCACTCFWSHHILHQMSPLWSENSLIISAFDVGKLRSSNYLSYFLEITYWLNLLFAHWDGVFRRWKVVWRFLKKLEMELPDDLAFLLLGTYLDNTTGQKDACTVCLQQYCFQ